MEGNHSETTYIIVSIYMFMLFIIGYPASERAVRGSTNIQVLCDEDQEGLRVACKVLFSCFNL